ncbi:hypothetical protein Csa_012034 [Cucumis sativus]|uniref:Uncharacterized protein n=1 Tax=Cucumis sativus TaxID=3659 RepID=A0A0A0L3L2_CUCSA|nr:hypothetical protein Csa_012034 [Cucumis sativus]
MKGSDGGVSISGRTGGGAKEEKSRENLTSLLPIWRRRGDVVFVNQIHSLRHIPSSATVNTHTLLTN